ncbi:MAG: type IV pilus assembly protein PilM [Candidatus Competibacterales bacterium]|nr:type IV pilus assembly protein PilM [Candidatus Competibacterales bacterium]
MFKTKERFLGVDISPSAVKVMELGRNGKRIQVEASASEPLPEGAVEDRNPVNVEQVAEALKQAIKNSGTRVRKAAVAVPTSSVITRTIPMPAEYGEDDIESAIEVDATQYIPFPLDEIYLDFEIRGASKSAQESQDVMLVAARREFVDLRQEVLKEAGLKTLIVDVEAYALENLFQQLCSYLYFNGAELDEVALKRLGGIRTAMIDVGALTTTLYIFNGQRVVFTREQPGGCEQLTQAIADAYGLTKERAELAKRSGDLSEDYISTVLEPFRESIAEQVNNALQFFFSSSNFNAVDSVVLTGGGGMVQGLDKTLADRLGTPTVIANPFEIMTNAKRVNRHGLLRDAPLYAVACGLALRSLDA